ncbi:MAG: VTT domain-containing protein [Pseudomonadota bacterium]|nr:VTT domain-containing protein [Pseudomonadota bacterium]
MPSLLDLLREFGLGFVFLNVLLEQGGLPIPAVPTMMVAGAVTAAPNGRLLALIAVAVSAALIADSFWYFTGRRIGTRVLRLLCRVSLSPDSCVRQTESVFARWGAGSMLVAKFIPGFSTVSTALAGAMRMRYWKFILFDALGATLWVSVAVGLGYLFREALSEMLATIAALGEWGLALLVGALVAYVASRWWQRHLFIRQLRMDRITVHELRERIENGAISAILDVRSRISQEATGRIPGARTIDLDSLEGLGEIVTDGEVVVYCACPNEASAVQLAKRLRAMGYKRVRPLHGGIDAWVAAGLEVAKS